MNQRRFSIPNDIWKWNLKPQGFATLAYAQFFKERMEQGPPGPPSLMLSATQLLHHMGNIFRDNVPEDSTSTGLHIDHKRLQALQEKRIALGHRPDDHVEQTMGGMTMR